MSHSPTFAFQTAAARVQTQLRDLAAHAPEFCPEYSAPGDQTNCAEATEPKPSTRVRGCGGRLIIIETFHRDYSPRYHPAVSIARDQETHDRDDAASRTAGWLDLYCAPQADPPIFGRRT
jgi:hypothetical protein